MRLGLAGWRNERERERERCYVHDVRDLTAAPSWGSSSSAHGRAIPESRGTRDQGTKVRLGEIGEKKKGGGAGLMLGNVNGT